jgi:hypothetical protein
VIGQPWGLNPKRARHVAAPFTGRASVVRLESSSLTPGRVKNPHTLGVRQGAEGATLKGSDHEKTANSRSDPIT